MKDVVLVDGSLVSMQLMLAARAYRYDTNPIGGMRKTKLQKHLDWIKTATFLLC
jgi:nitroreductase